MMAYAKSMRYSIIVAEKNTMYKFQGAPMYMIFLGNVLFFSVEPVEVSLSGCSSGTSRTQDRASETNLPSTLAL